MSTPHPSQFTPLIPVHFNNPVVFSQAPHYAPLQHLAVTPSAKEGDRDEDEAKGADEDEYDGGGEDKYDDHDQQPQLTPLVVYKNPTRTCQPPPCGTQLAL
ncbi:hypothetical protein J1N35_028735 [Gossypium stocksii]|uniref:Uncharacterized protein n=1 Tax=Gossypium stocksii TaxID=47602 RepID=A0A9D3UWW0_9ROSI|nr:hypothetical protein J1N35_028735 [Gossypium stocksii]